MTHIPRVPQGRSIWNSVGTHWMVFLKLRTSFHKLIPIKLLVNKKQATIELELSIIYGRLFFVGTWRIGVYKICFFFAYLNSYFHSSLIRFVQLQLKGEASLSVSLELLLSSSDKVSKLNHFLLISHSALATFQMYFQSLILSITIATVERASSMMKLIKNL